MRKPKIYLDTSVISHLEQEDAPDKMADTLKLWEDFKQNKYDVYVSGVTIIEVDSCRESKRSNMFKHLYDIPFMELDETETARELAREYINLGILTQKSYDDCLHIAIATINGIDIITSWNFKHMVKYKTIEGIRKANAENGYYKIIDIIQPSLLLEMEE